MSLSSLRLVSCRRTFCTSQVRFSGHNKWSKIKGKKGALDAQKGVLYGKISRHIVIAVRQGGPDPETNPSLSAALRTAKTIGVPKDNIEKALAKATGSKEKAGQLLKYEVMAYGSVGLLIECLTDNVNRTVLNLREILNKHNAHFAPVGFLFTRKGLVRVDLEKGDGHEERMEQLIETALEAGAEDFETVDSPSDLIELEFKCPSNALAKLTLAVMAPGRSRELLASELIYAPVERGEEPEETAASSIADLVDAIEQTEDCLSVWTTLD